MSTIPFRYDFFISYERSISGEFARKLQHELSANFGKKAFLDQKNIAFGKKWETEIRKALTDTHIFVVLLPLASDPSLYVVSEVTIALDLARSDPKRKIVWVYIGEEKMRSADLTLGLHAFQGISDAKEEGVRNVAIKLASDHLVQSGYSGIKLFPSRDDATKEMLEDLSRATHAYFMGISHSKLWSYLQQLAENTDQRKLPLQHVEVYFANNELGNLIEPNQFSMNIREAMLKLGIVVKSHPRFSDPEITFYQFPHILTPSGSRFKLSNDDEDIEDIPFSVIYNVFPERGTDLSVSWTLSIRYSMCDPSTKDIFRREVVSFERLAKTRKHVFTVSRRNIWDESGEAWNTFEGDYPVYDEIYNTLWDFGEIAPDHKVLDFGSGTGSSMQTVAEQLQEGSLTLVDTSPGMLSYARNTFANDPRVNIILGDACGRLPGKKHLEHKFDRITSCLSLQSFADNIGSIKRFAENCKRYLHQDGQVIIGVHNSFIDCPPPEGFKTWQDPFRAALEEELMKRELPMKNRRSQKKFKQKQIIEVFQRAGFINDNVEIRTFPRTIEDRVAMWLTPAVFDSVTDVRKVGQKQHREIVENAGIKSLQQETMPTTVVMMCFSRPYRSSEEGKKGSNAPHQWGRLTVPG